jgi:hypothetical protein
MRVNDIVAVRMIEQQRQVLQAMTDLTDCLLRIGELEITRQPALAAEQAG